MAHRQGCLLFALFLFLEVASTAGAQSPPLQPPVTGINSQALQDGSSTGAFVLGIKPYEAPSAPMPAKGATYLDPSFKMIVVRLTDKAADAY